MKEKIKMRWMGTIPLFVVMLAVIFMVWLSCFVLSWKILIGFGVASAWILSSFSIPISILFFVLILNIRIPRKRTNPSVDLSEDDIISEGAWTKVFREKDSKRVVKQLYFCGWGHNDYTQHKSPIIGSKICGKWNPLSLWFLHYYMILYQIIGLYRRVRFEHQIDAFPSTINIQWKKLRYEQSFVLSELTPENCPTDIQEQFENLNRQLKESGLYIDDIHARNVRINEEGKIKLVDGELYSEGEEWIKSKLVVLFNGPVVSGMMPVLGQDRIIAWVDHRQTVDDVVAIKRCN
ncbi:MAG: hypothetical protein ACI9N1_002536 [Flavobacteriales bacterium]|jgi:hypothetical protein